MPRTSTTLAAAILTLASVACGPTPVSADSVGTTTSSSTSTSTGTGTDTSDAADTGETGLACDEEALSQCDAVAIGSLQDCISACPAPPILTCENEHCRNTCGRDFNQAELACAEQHCPGADEQEQLCAHSCYEDAVACTEAPSCELHSCAWEASQCVAQCEDCFVGVRLYFSYAGDCTLTPPVPVSDDIYAFVEGPDRYWVVEPSGSCDDPEIHALLSEARDSVILCPQACQLFGDQGWIELQISGSENCP